jgi:hypothetical protein
MDTITLRFAFDDVVHKDINIRHEVARALQKQVIDTGEELDYDTIRHIVSSDPKAEEIVVVIEDTNALNRFTQLPVVVIDETDATVFEKKCAELVLQGYYLMTAHAGSASDDYENASILIAVYVLPRYIAMSENNPHYLPGVLEELNSR